MSEHTSISAPVPVTKAVADREVLPVQKPLEEDVISEDLQPLYVQPKLTVGAPDDPYEKRSRCSSR